MRRAAAILAVSACAGGSAHRAPDPDPRPRLVVLVVIDQLPDWAFSAKLPHLDGGIVEIVARGRRYLGEYPHAATATAAGHATLGTGASPHVTGILANEWYRPELGREVAAVDDGTGVVTTAALRVPGLADAMAAARPAAHAVAIALKPRAALLPLGQHGGLGVWYDSARVGWSVNVDPRPAWVDALAAAHPVAPRLDYVWQPEDAAALARESGVADAAPGELGTHRFGATFPHRLAEADVPAKAVVATPLGTDLELEAADAALAGAELGTDDEPDYLVISFSVHDYVAHAWGQESWETWDVVHRIDHHLAHLVDELDRRVGAGRWAMILTSDHGGAPMAERHGAGRHAYAEIQAIAEAAAVTVAGPPPPSASPAIAAPGAGSGSATVAPPPSWIATVRYPTLYLGPAARALPAATRDAMLDAIVTALRGQRWLRRVVRRDQIDGDCAALTGDDARLCWAVDPGRSGEVVFAPARYEILHEDDEVTATHHGSLEDYDYQVPLIVLGPGFAPGVDVAPVSMLRVVPTLARWLRVPPPAAATAPPL